MLYKSLSSAMGWNVSCLEKVSNVAVLVDLHPFVISLYAAMLV